MRVLTWVLALAAAYALVVGALALGQRRLIYLPFGEAGEPGAAGLPGVARVTVRTADGLALAAWWRPALPGQPTILYLHGNAGSLALRAPKVRPYLDAGYGLLLLAWRGFSGNPGRPSEAGLIADGRAALAFLARQGIATADLVLYGESIGASVAVELALADRFRALVLEAPMTSLPELAQRHFPWAPARWLVRDRYDSLAKIARIQAPLLIVHGERDEVVPVAMGRRLLEAAPEPKQGVFPPFARHNDLAEHGLSAAVLRFLAGISGRAGSFQVNPPET